MSNNISEKSFESLSEGKIFTSPNTQNKIQKNLNIKSEEKNIINLSKQISRNEELLRNKLMTTTNDIENASKQDITNDINLTENKKSLALTLSPIKKGIKKRNMLVDLMEKSKKSEYKKSVIFKTQELKLKEENTKNERKDVYGVPINKKNKKKIKVTFLDTINTVKKQKDKNKLVEIIPITSYKKYNYIEGLPREEDIIANKSTCKCCFIY